jgi:integrase
MARETLSDLKVRSAKPPETGRRDLWDALVPGLSLRVTSNGHKSWSVVSRLRGRVVRHTLGSFPALPLAQAREQAREALVAFQAGRDPRTSAGLSTEKLWDLYFQGVRASPSHLSGMAGAWRMYLKPRFGSLPLSEIKRGEAAELLAEIARTKPAQATHVRSYLAAFLNWAVDRGLLEVSPIAGMKPLARRKSRDRVYTDPEIKAIWQAPVKKYGKLVKLIFATAQRRSQVSRMDWNQVDLSRGVWTAPTKAGRLHPLPLSPLALELLGEQGTGRVFPTRPNWARLADEIRLGPGVPPDFRFHDLRRTAATRMAELGVKREVVDAVLDHAAGGVTGIYQRYGYLEEMRSALALWGQRLAMIVA